MSGRRGLLLLSLATYAFFSALMAVTSIIARYSRSLGFTVAETGVMFSLAPLAAGALRIPVGVAADRLGGRFFIVAGPLLAGLAGLVASLSHSIEGLMAARVVQGVALASFVAPSIYAASMLRGVSPARAIAFRSAAIAAASSTAPYIAGVIVDLAGYRWGFLYAAAMGFAGAAFASLVPIAEAPGHASRAGFREALRQAARVAPVVAASALDGLVFLGFQSLPQAHLRDLGYPASVFGLALALNGVAGVPFRLYASRLIPRVGCLSSMGLGYLAAVAGLAMLRVRVEPPLTYAAGFLYGAGLGLVVPAEQVVVVSNTEPRVRNTVLSIYTLAFDAGGFWGSSVLGGLADAFGYTAAYTSMLLAELASLLLVSSWALRRGFRSC